MAFSTMLSEYAITESSLPETLSDDESFQSNNSKGFHTARAKDLELFFCFAKSHETFHNEKK